MSFSSFLSQPLSIRYDMRDCLPPPCYPNGQDMTGRRRVAVSGPVNYRQLLALWKSIGARKILAERIIGLCRVLSNRGGDERPWPVEANCSRAGLFLALGPGAARVQIQAGGCTLHAARCARADIFEIELFQPRGGRKKIRL